MATTSPTRERPAQQRRALGDGRNVSSNKQQAQAGCPVEAYARDAAAIAREILRRPKSHRTLDDNGNCKCTPLYDKLNDLQTYARDTEATSDVGAAYQAILLHQHGGLLGSSADPEANLTRRQRARISVHDDFNARTALSILAVLLRNLEDGDLYLLFMWSDLPKASNDPAILRAEFERYVRRLRRPEFMAEVA